MANPVEMLKREERLSALYRMLTIKELCAEDLVEIFSMSEVTMKEMCRNLLEQGNIVYETKIVPSRSSRSRRFYKATDYEFVPKTLAEITDSLKGHVRGRMDGYLKFGVGKFLNPFVKEPTFTGKAKKYSPLDYVDYSNQRIKVEPNRGIGSSFNII